MTDNTELIYLTKISGQILGELEDMRKELVAIRSDVETMLKYTVTDSPPSHKAQSEREVQAVKHDLETIEASAPGSFASGSHRS